MDRMKRKEEGKLRKRQRIEEFGGTRPRVEAKNKLSSSPKTQSKTFDDTRNVSHGKEGNVRRSVGSHRFGRVMDVVPSRNKPRYSTVSIAVPGSVVANCQTRELRTQICGQIARAATIYHVDEIIVYDDKLSSPPRLSTSFNTNNKNRHVSSNSKSELDSDKLDKQENTNDNNTDQYHRVSQSDPHAFMARILQYCECPQYLRRHFFPMHTDLQFAGLLPPIDPPHHVRAEDPCRYREGVVLEEKYIANTTTTNNKNTYVGRLVNCGIRGRPVL